MSKPDAPRQSALPARFGPGVRLLLLAAALMTGPAVQADCQKLVISAPPEYPPFAYLQGDEFTGAGVELAALIAADAGLVADIRYAPSWARVYAGHLEGSVDLIAALYKTPERLRSLTFLDSYAAERTMVVATKARPIRFETWDDLKPLMGAVVNGDSRGDVLDHYIAENLKVHKVHSFQYVANLLSAGRADYALVGEFSPNAPAFDYRSDASPFYAIDTPMSSEFVYMSLSKASACAGMAQRLDTHLRARILDGTVERLLVKHARKPAP